VPRDWPEGDEWEALASDDRLAEEDAGRITVRDGTVELDVELPMPGVVRVRLSPRDVRGDGLDRTAATF
jgi:xylan 1,4-beta-xylosidase